MTMPGGDIIEFSGDLDSPIAEKHNQGMKTIAPPESAPTTSNAPPSPKLTTRQRLIVAGASFGAFLLASVPIGLLLLLAQADDVNFLIIALATSLAGTMFAVTAGLIVYLIIKT